MSLSLALGEDDPFALLQRMDCRTFQFWKAYHDLSPWGETRADMRAEAQRQRLTIGIFGLPAGVDEAPDGRYPYWKETATPEDLLELKKYAETRLVAMPDGSHVLKD